MLWFSGQTDTPRPVKTESNHPISRLRKQYGMSQSHLAEALDVSQPMIAQVESGARSVPVSWDVDASCEEYTANRDADRSVMRRICNEVMR